MDLSSVLRVAENHITIDILSFLHIFSCADGVLFHRFGSEAGIANTKSAQRFLFRFSYFFFSLSLSPRVFFANEI